MKKIILTVFLFILCCTTSYGMMFTPYGSVPAVGGGGGAPTNAQYLVGIANAVLTNEIVVSANGQATVTAANYAAMRGLWDLEVGVDFYSIVAADAAHEGELVNSAGLIAALNDETGTLLSVFSDDPTFTTNINTPQVTFNNQNASPNAVGELLYDNTITGLEDGGMTWYDSTEIKILIDLDASEGDLEAGDEGEVVTYNWSGGSGYFDLQPIPGGYTNLTEFVDQTAWRVFYSDTNGDVTELALGADGEYLMSNGPAVAPTFETPAGAGDVSAAAVMTDHTIVRGDGGAKGIQDTGIAIDDADNMTGVGTFDAGAGGMTVDADGDTGVKSLTVDPSATPTHEFHDSDGLGADKFSGSISSNMTDTTDGAEDSDVTLTYMDAGTPTAAIIIDGSDNEIVPQIPVNMSAETITLSTVGGVIDAGAATSLEIPNGNAAPAVLGQLRLDTVVANHTDGALRWYDSNNIRHVVDMVAATAEGCTDDQVVSYDAAADLFYCKDDDVLVDIVESVVWNAAGMVPDGTQCEISSTAVQINSGPLDYTAICADNDASSLYGHIVMPDSWNGGTVTFELEYLQTAADTDVLNSDIAAMCRGATETVNNTWSAEAAIDDAAVTGSNAVDHTTSAAVTPNGTCAGGDTLYFRWQMDAGGTTTAVATLHFLGMKMEYTSTVGD